MSRVAHTTFKSQTVRDLEDTLRTFVDDVNQHIETLNATQRQGVESIQASDIYMPMIERFAREYQQSTLSEMLVQANPHLAIELGFLTLREALREGVIPLTKEHVLDKVIGYRELPREIIEALDFTPEEYQLLKQ